MNTLDRFGGLPGRGRERPCQQCGDAYRALRSDSLYCSPTCRQRAARGAPTVAAQGTRWVGKALLMMEMAGKIGPVNAKDPRRPVYGLTVPRSTALAELNSRFPPAMTDAEFGAELKALGFYGYDEDPPKGLPQRRRAAR